MLGFVGPQALLKRLNLFSEKSQTDRQGLGASVGLKR